MEKRKQYSLSIFLVISLLMFSACHPTDEPVADLLTQDWIHGAADCSTNTDPVIQVVQYNKDTWILRQSKCNNYEAPFMFLFFGEDKALLMDTGATKDSNVFPLYKTVQGIIEEWSVKHGPVDLVVAHTHKHGDHYAADDQFKGKANTTVVGLEVPELSQFFGVSNWPDEQADYDLGDRVLKIIPIPGHQASSVALYDISTKILLTGDTFYPGRLYVSDWPAFKASINKLTEFTASNKVTYILGNHIEMTSEAGKDYPIGTTYQPDELPLPLNQADLEALNQALQRLGDTPTKEVHDNFIIFPINR